jgi:hypothetical protein
MTENTTPVPSEAPATIEQTAEAENKLNTKAIWAGVGIGSAALVAALMYATKRPKRRGK